MSMVPPIRRGWLFLDIVVILVASVVVLPSTVMSLGPFLARVPGLAPAGRELLTRLAAISLQEAGLILLTLASLRYGYRCAPGTIGLTHKGFFREVGIGLLAVGPLFLLKTLTSQAGIAVFRLIMPAKQVAAALAAENAVVGELFRSGSAGLTWSFAFMLILVAPIAEEIFFRGFSCEILRERLGSRGAILASASIFAAIHLYLVQFLPVFAMGVGLAWLYETRRSLVSPMVAHIILNLAAVILLLAGKS